MVQASEIIEKTGQIAKESGWQTALLIFIVVAGAGFFTWLVRFALVANEKGRLEAAATQRDRDKEFLAYQRERDKEMKESNDRLAEAIRILSDEIRRPRK